MPFGFLLSTYDKPHWKKEFENNISELEWKTGINQKKLLELADVLEEMKIIKL